MRASAAWKMVVGAVVVTAVGAGVTLWSGRSISAGPAQGSVLHGLPSTLPASPTLRLATFNIDGGQGTDDQLDLARTARSLQRIDVVALEEVHASSDADNQAVTLGGLLHLPYLYVPAERRWGHDSFGNAFLTDLPVTRWTRVVLPSDVWHAKRNYLSAEAQWMGRPLHVIATHVDFKGEGDAQLADVIAVFLALPAPAVLLGDLNHPRSDGQIQRLITTPGVEECYTHMPQLDPVPGRVDWIFVRGLHTVDAGSVDLKASDHPAYWAEVVPADGGRSAR